MKEKKSECTQASFFCCFFGLCEKHLPQPTCLICCDANERFEANLHNKLCFSGAQEGYKEHLTLPRISTKTIYIYNIKRTQRHQNQIV